MTTPWGITASVLMHAATIAAAETTGLSIKEPFKGRGSFVDWAEWTTAALAILIVLIVLFTLLFGRRQSNPLHINFLRFVGLCALPVFLLVVGTFANFEGSKRVEFCHSCHTAMDLYVDDMRDPASNTLAARHYKNRYIQEEQCYHCHADYGVNGAIGAKSRGLIHLYYWVKKSATAQGKEQIQLYGYYDNKLCLYCHAGGHAFLSINDHLDFQNELMEIDAQTGAPGMSCMACHEPAHLSLQDKRSVQKGSP